MASESKNAIQHPHNRPLDMYLRWKLRLIHLSLGWALFPLHVWFRLGLKDKKAVEKIDGKPELHTFDWHGVGSSGLKLKSRRRRENCQELIKTETCEAAFIWSFNIQFGRGSLVLRPLSSSWVSHDGHSKSRPWLLQRLEDRPGLARQRWFWYHTSTLDPKFTNDILPSWTGREDQRYAQYLMMCVSRSVDDGIPVRSIASMGFHRLLTYQQTVHDERRMVFAGGVWSCSGGRAHGVTLRNRMADRFWLGRWCHIPCRYSRWDALDDAKRG